MLHFGGADAERQRAEGAVGGGVGVAADDGGTGSDAELGAHHVDYALVLVVQVIQTDPELLAVGGQRLHLMRAIAGGGDVLGGGGDVVIHGGPGQIRAAQLASSWRAGRRMPAGWSLHAPGGGRCR